MAVVAGCHGKACGGFGGFETFAAALNARKNRWPSCFWLEKACARRCCLEMLLVAGCQEVQGACLEGCLGKACGGFGGFGGFEGFERV